MGRLVSVNVGRPRILHGVTIELVSRAILLDKSLRERAVSAPELAPGLLKLLRPAHAA